MDRKGLNPWQNQAALYRNKRVGGPIRAAQHWRGKYYLGKNAVGLVWEIIRAQLSFASY